MNASTLEAAVIRQAARGTWLNVLRYLAPELIDAIEQPGRKHIPCPVHGGKDGFRLFRDVNLSGGGCCNTCGPKPDGFSLLMWLRDWTFPESLLAVAETVGLSSAIPRFSASTIPNDPLKEKSVASAHNARLKQLLKSIWQESLSIQHPAAEPARLYLQSRGLDSGIPDWPSLRFHSKLQYRNDANQVIGYYPALLALVQKGHQGITVHRTFLTREGQKAPVEAPKKMMPFPNDLNVVGSGIYLGNPGRLLYVTEGIETALAVFEATGIVTWSLINATLMSQFIIPKGVEKLIIWSDFDRINPETGLRPGSEAAKKLAQRAKTQGVDVEIREPFGPLPAGAKSIDWLDVLNTQGPNAFAFKSLY